MNLHTVLPCHGGGERLTEFVRHEASKLLEGRKGSLRGRQEMEGRREKGVQEQSMYENTRMKLSTLCTDILEKLK